MLFRAAVACAETLSAGEAAEGRTFPRIARIREVSYAVAVAVIHEALKEGLATKITPKTLEMESVEHLVKRKMYFPRYVPLVDPR